MRIIKTIQPKATRTKFSFVNDDTNEIFPCKTKSDALHLLANASGRPFDIREPYTEYRWTIADRSGAAYPDDCFVFTGENPPPDFFHFMPLADATELEPIVPASKIKTLALKHDMRVSGTDKAIEDQFQILCTFFTRAFDEKDKYRVRLAPLKEVQELLSIFSTYHMPKGMRFPVGNSFGSNIVTLAALFCDMTFNADTQSISLPSVLSGKVANWMVAESQYSKSAWSQMRPRQGTRKIREPIAQPSIKQVDEQNGADAERMKIKRFDDWKKRYWESPKGIAFKKEFDAMQRRLASAHGMTYEEYIEAGRIR